MFGWLTKRRKKPQQRVFGHAGTVDVRWANFETGETWDGPYDERPWADLPFDDKVKMNSDATVSAATDTIRRATQRSLR